MTRKLYTPRCFCFLIEMSSIEFCSQIVCKSICFHKNIVGIKTINATIFAYECNETLEYTVLAFLFATSSKKCSLCSMYMLCDAIQLYSHIHSHARLAQSQSAVAIRQRRCIYANGSRTHTYARIKRSENE